MDTAVFPEDVVVKKVSIVGSELVENYTVYVIEVKVRDHRWTIKHRYSDFHDLHEKLTAEKKIEKHLLPPKKMIGKNSKSLVEKRQKELEVYLQTLLVRFPTAAPKVLSYFLHFHQYEMNGITAALAEELFHKGEQLLVAGEVFTLCPLQLYAITQQLKLAKPTCSNGDAKADLGHILDFTCRLKYLKITGTRGEVGTSNIQEDSLTFDLSVFKALLQIEISDCNSAQIMGLPSLKPCLVTLNVHHSAASMMDVLVPEACVSPQWVAEGTLTDRPVATIIPTWKTLTTLDMSHNHIVCIDNSVKLIPKVEFLDLSSNELSMVENLQHLYNLIHLDLSYNILTVLEGAHTKLGNIKTLNLAGNQLDSLAGLTKLYSLVNLDLSSNKLGQLEEIRYIGMLPCLERLVLSNNPMCIIPDYRTKVLAQFWDRASEVCLDSTAPTEKELDTVEVLKAIQKAKESKDRMANSHEKKVSEDSRLSGGGSSISPSVAAASSSSSSLLSSALAPACSSQGNHVCIRLLGGACSAPIRSSSLNTTLSLSLARSLLLNQSCVKGGYAAHLVETAMLSSQTSQRTTSSTNPTLTPTKTSTNPDTFTLQTLTNPLLSDILSHVVTGGDRDSSCCVPCVLFLTQRHLCVLKVDFKALARGTTGDEPSDDHNQRLRSCSRLSRIPLASVLPHPRPSALYGAGAGDSRVLELLVGQERVTAVFPLPHDMLRFQKQFTLLRSSLRDIKTVAFLQGGNEHSHSDGDNTQGRALTVSYQDRGSSIFHDILFLSLSPSSPRGAQRPRPSLSLSYPTDILVEKLTGDNQVPSHLSLSPALSLVSGLRGHQLLGFFHTNIAEEEKEELHHILWSSVVFYKSPDVEATSCIMLSTKALYFLLDDSASTLNDQSRKTNTHTLIMSYCFTINLHDLHSVNVGLFDQYFRVVGPSADHIICCLTRDSYGTHRFLQQLMTVLSLQDKLPSPEPSEQDFYTQFGNKSTGKMGNYELVHSSRVKFIYPSEEEIGDLTFIVAERKGPSGASSCNILLYVLVFQVLPPQAPSTPRPVLHPKTLILTSTDVFLLDEDYISYPLPDFAKEPPPRDKYQLTDARRIRDLDRVLMGYQTYPQALTLVFDDVPGPDLLCQLTMDHFGEEEVGGGGGEKGRRCGRTESEVLWCIYVPGADSRERLICLLARQWEVLCSRELPVELTG
uniref:Nischarin n=1 Tax=Oncorhynchus kisutch TaxID=8019 RepID=A0A8C7GJX3_ONCKI